MKITRLLYLSISYGNIALQLLLLPIFANYLGIVAYGEFSFGISIVSWIAFFSTLGTQTRLRRILTGKNISALDEISIKETSNCGILVGILFIFTSFLFLLFNSFIPRLNFSLYQQLLMLIYCFVYILISLQNSVLIANQRIVLSVIIGAIFTSGSLIFVNILFEFIVPSWDLRLLLAILLGFSILIFYRSSVLIVFSLRYFDFTSILRGGKDNLILASYGLYDKLISLGDKVFVGFYFGVEALAIYTIGFQISNVVYSGAKAFTIFAENAIFTSGGGVVRQYILTMCFSITVSFLVLIFLNFTFEYLFSSEFSGAMDFLYLQLIIAILRVFNNLQFTRSYVNGTTKRYLLFCYSFIFIFVVIFFNFQDITLYQFILYFLALQLANAVMSLKYAASK